MVDTLRRTTAETRPREQSLPPDEAERRQVPSAWNATATPYPEGHCLHELIEAQVQRTPDAVAVTFEGEQLSYRALDERAERIATHLRGLGVGPEVLVGICAERSVELVIGLLAVLKAGGAYVPLDPEYPEERLAYMLADAQAPVLLTQRKLLTALPPYTGAVVCLDGGEDDWHERASVAPGIRPRQDVTPANLAYAIYTSGSTGRPKGALNTHRGIVNRLHWMQATYQLTTDDRVLQKTPISFDVSVWEFFWPLMTGARLVLARPGGHREPSYLADLIAREGITTLHFVPAMLHAFLEEPELERRCASVRRVICSGEALPADLQRRVFERLGGDVELHNLYGPTEAAVDVTWWACERGDTRTSVPIGRPIANTQIHLLDEHCAPVPVGEPGELYIGGVQVGRGYLNRPELTAERFVPDPFSHEPGARLYRTGDLARYWPEGEIEYLGRLDFQVKIRGLRIELGEIEAALSEHPGVRECVVIAREDGPGTKRLAAYIVPFGEATSAHQSGDHRVEPLTSSRLRSHVQARLPEYMVPSAFVFLPALPLTPNGKVDRKALPAPLWDRSMLDTAYEAPRTASEEVLAGIWAAVLGLEQVGIRDDFFALGGDSLLATRVIARLRQCHRYELSLRTFFDHPITAGLAAKMEAAEAANAFEDMPELHAVERTGTMPLSFAQQRLWFLDQLQPDSAAYNMIDAVRLIGSLDQRALEATLREIVRRHEVVRTTFQMRDGQLQQVVMPADGLGTLSLVDMQGEPVDDHEAAVQRIAQEEAQRPFDLAHGPLLRTTLVRLAPDEHVLFLAMHHIISDGWSLGVLHDEIAALYTAYATGQPSPLPELPIQYADFAAWQRTWLQGARLEAQLDYWREQLAGAPTILELPGDHPRPAVQTFRGARHTFALPASLHAELRALSHREGSTPFMTLLAAFQTLLARYTGQHDVVVGTPIAGRTHVETEDLIGFFVNTLALRTNLTGDPLFTDAMRRVREVALAAYAHQDVPFEQVVEALRVERDLSRSPLVQVMFALQNAPDTALDLPGLRAQPLDVESGTVRFDLELHLFEDESGLRGAIEYNTDLFEADTIQRLASHFHTLLQSIVSDPTQHISALTLTTEAERQQLLVEWNATETAYPATTSVHALVEAQLARNPGKVAVTYGDESLTYRDLNQRANQLARYLQQVGVGIESRVGLCVERSLELIVGMLGILKAGGAYVPLDPSYPADRLAYMLADSQVKVLVTQAHLRGLLPAEWEGLVVCLDGDVAELATQSAENLALPVAASNLAYVMYTSGSTGLPKGICIPHQAIVRLIRDTDYIQLHAGDRVAQASNASFDAATFEIWGALACGACLIGIPKEAALAPQVLAERLQAERITTLFLTTALFNQVVQEAPQAFASLEHLLFGGEAVDPHAVRHLLEHTPPGRLLHVYGPTESTTFATWSLVARDDVSPASLTVPIGRPVANTHAYVLDAQLQPVPVGIPGELYIGGDGLARGYWQRPALTAERFIPHPFSTTPGARLYKTGDQVRLRPDGQIEFIGRLDTQVKIRGLRIELGEIEAVLRQHPDVRDCLVVARNEQPGGKRLVAYVVAEGPYGTMSAELRRFLRERLPEYMVPAAFVTLESFPLTPNGKVDRRLLPAPQWDRTALDGDYVPPSTPIQELLANIWSEQLGLDQVGIHDNFFEVGGHSLLATRVHAHIRATLQVELPLRTLFEAPTIAELAGHMERILQAGQQSQIPPLEVQPRDEHVPLSFAQERLWFLDQLEPDTAVYNVPLAVRLTGALDVPALERSIQDVVQRHEALRTVFTVEGGQPRQRLAPVAACPLRVEDVHGATADEREAHVRQRLREEAHRPFHLDRDLPIRALVLRLDAAEHVLLLTLHHIASDGWSLDVLARELSALYTAHSAGQPATLPPLPVQYADYALWQREWLAGAALDEQLDYWRQHLAGAPAVLDLPTDHPRPSTQTFAGAVRTTTLSSELTDKLQKLSRREGVTLFMTLLAAFEALLARYSRQDDLVIGIPIANRSQAETESLIGFFVNTLPMRGNLRGNPTFRELLTRVREACLGAFAHQDLPFEKLIENLQLPRDASRAPLVQVLFTLQNDPVLPDLAGLRAERQPVERETAKFDLLMAVEVRPDGLHVEVEYNTDLFEAVTIERLLGHYHTLLAGAAAEPHQPLALLPLLTTDERTQMLEEWTATAASFPTDQCIHQLFEAQVERTPDAIAATYEGQELTYTALNVRANQLAHYLRRLGVGPEVRVGLCLERSLDLLVGMLAILKAGGAYIPLDPVYPAERLTFMLQDGEAAVLLTQSHLVERLPKHHARVVCLDADQPAIAREAASNPTSGISPANLAYVIYTSGSTGRPKGVAIQHRGTVALLEWARTLLTPEQTAGVLAATSICFDLSVFEVFVPLSRGGTIILCQNLLRLLDAPPLADVTLINTVPSALAEVLRDGALPASVRVVNLAGEPFPNALAQRVYQHERVEHVFNLYGPSEDTTYSTVYRVHKGSERPPLIGQPLANTRIYLLDVHMQPVPIGIPGELYIGSASLARGYLGRPELTAERFVPDPFSREPGARLYRTGDLCRYLPDGTIDFLGRIDHQVKVRGFRIELGEIEARLLEHPAIRESVALVREDRPGDKRLVAYVVAEPEAQMRPGHELPGAGAAETGRALREHLRRQLPEYMVPAEYVFLSVLPLTPNGKVDRKALPTPSLDQQAPGGEYVAPRTAHEAMLAGIWEQVLGRAQVGVYDNFFELGGHSLLATQVIARARDAFRVDLPLRLLFEQPTVAGMAEQIEANYPADDARMPDVPLAPLPRTGALPLSFSQQRLWFLDQLQPNNPFYNMPMAWRLIGPLDTVALEASLNAIVQRHEVLRTTITSDGGSPTQHIAPELRLALPVVDLGELSEAERARELQRLARAEAEQPFGLAKGPLIRASLLRLAPEEHVLLVTLHHIVGDGWSLDVLLRELAALYADHIAGRPATLPPLPIQYADYAVWQRECLQGDVLDGQLAYWKAQLAGVPAMLDLPSDHPRPTVQTFRGATCTTILPAELTNSLAQLSRREDATLFMTLLAAFETLLGRYTGRDDLVVGTAVAGRTRAETETLIGCFVNTLPMRANLAGDPSFRELLARVREVCLGAFAHQDLPFEQLVEALQVARDVSHTPLVQVGFTVQNAAQPLRDLAGLQVESLPVEYGTAKLDLTLAADVTGSGLRLEAEYNADLFEPATIERLLSHYGTLLAGIVADAGQPLSRLPLLAEAEQHTLLHEWNATRTPYPEDQCLHHLFEAQARRTPAAAAVVYEGAQLTYRELDQRANQLAHYLQTLGVGPEVLVGICAERSIELVVGILGILKAGGAFIPLDPAYPSERLAYMLADSRAPVLLTQKRLLDRLPEHRARVLCLDALDDALDQQPATPPDSGVTVAHLAYVIYTSGSTGKPKGVAVTHRGTPNLATAQQQLFHLDEQSRVLQFSSLSFDASVWELLMALSIGARLCLVPNPQLLSGQSLAQVLRDNEVTAITLPPSVLASLPASETLPTLRTVVVAGEACPAELVARWGASRQFFNAYGPTETTVCATAHRCTNPHERPPIGRPIANAQVYVLDGHGNPVPVGVPGELHIGGAGLARGYLGRPDLTAERFVPDPFGGESGARLYKTGDLARWHSDGTLEFLGRLDHQVKLRGFRIELGEVEAALGAHPQANEAIAVVREDRPGDKRLVAYVVPRQPATLTVADMRHFLKERLPEYMVPSAIVLLEALPLTANGKVDRKALPAPEAARAGQDEHFVMPRGEVEEAIATVWQNVLGVARVGADENFFEAGGDSLLMAQVHSGLRRALDTDVCLIDLFRYPTVGSLAAYLGQGGDKGTQAAESEGARERARKKAEALRRRGQTRAARGA